MKKSYIPVIGLNKGVDTGQCFVAPGSGVAKRAVLLVSFNLREDVANADEESS